MMSIEYTIIPGHGGGPDGKGAWMTHSDRKLGYETACDGCGMELPGTVTIITDRSGSEYAATHDSDGCVTAAIAKLY